MSGDIQGTTRLNDTEGVEKALAEGSVLHQKKCKKRVRCEVQEEKVEETCSKRGSDHLSTRD
jgi:hypothetical protein